MHTSMACSRISSDGLPHEIERSVERRAAGQPVATVLHASCPQTTRRAERVDLYFFRFAFAAFAAFAAFSARSRFGKTE